MTKKELIKALEPFKEDDVVICQDEQGGWDNIQRLEHDGGSIVIIFGGRSPFSDE